MPPVKRTGAGARHFSVAANSSHLTDIFAKGSPMLRLKSNIGGTLRREVRPAIPARAEAVECRLLLSTVIDVSAVPPTIFSEAAVGADSTVYVAGFSPRAVPGSNRSTRHIWHTDGTAAGTSLAYSGSLPRDLT